MKKSAVALVALATFALAGGSANATVRLKMADALAKDHPTSIVLQEFAKEVQDKTNGQVKIRIFFNAVLGSEPEVLEQLQNGAVDMTRVSAASLENFNPIFESFTLPYIFRDESHFYRVMEGPVADEVYQATRDNGFIGLTFFDSGARSFYTKDKQINTPDDLKGQKIRVMNSQTAIRAVQMMGATPTPLAYSEIYTGLQQGVIDGAENNPTALTVGRHGEVAKYYSLDEHMRIPDFLIISNSAWNKLTDDQKKAVKEVAEHATQLHRVAWDKATNEALAQAKEMGVEITTPDRAAFRDKVKPLIDEYRQDPKINELVTKIIDTK